MYTALEIKAFCERMIEANQQYLREHVNDETVRPSTRYYVEGKIEAYTEVIQCADDYIRIRGEDK